MSLVVSVLVVVAFAFLCRRPLRLHPGVFYCVAVVISAFGIYLTMNPAPSAVVRVVAFAIQKGHVGFSMFILVMFIGVFARSSVVRKALAPVRAELSIMGSILIAGHFIPYLSSYLSMAADLFSLRPAVATSCILAVLLLVLLVPLFATSFPRVKKAMPAHWWMRVQRLAYPFFILAFFHLFGFFFAALLNGSPRAVTMCIVYAAILVAYVVARVHRRIADEKADAAIEQS